MVEFHGKKYPDFVTVLALSLGDTATPSACNLMSRQWTVQITAIKYDGQTIGREACCLI